jgi:hypothetical protein
VQFTGYIRRVGDMKYLRTTKWVVIEPDDDEGNDADDGGGDEEITLHP